MYDLNTLRRLNNVDVHVNARGQLYYEKTVRGRTVRVPVPDQSILPPGVIIIRHS